MNYFYLNAAKPRHVYENQINMKTYENSAAMNPEDGYEVPESESNFLSSSSLRCCMPFPMNR